MQLLTTRTWREIRLVAQVYDLAFDTNQTRQQALLRVRGALGQPEGLPRYLRRLSEPEREPLLALLHAGGALPLHRFMKRYGEIRPYRPWRDPEARFYWKCPISPAERLWHLGMIEIQRGRGNALDMVCLPDDVAALLPPKQRPRYTRLACPTPVIATPPMLIRDMAAFLAGLLAGEVRLRHQRWLILRSMRQINRRFVVAEPLAGVRGERQTGRLRWIHYLLRITGLMENGLPAASAWRWLSEPDPWERLWEGVHADLGSPDPVWNAFGLPPVDQDCWHALTAFLGGLVPGRLYDRDACYANVRFELERPVFDALMETVLTWSGRVGVQGEYLWIQDSSLPDEQAQDARISLSGDALIVDLPDCPRLRPFVEVSSWATIESANTLRIDPDALRRAIQHGEDAASVIRVLADLCGLPLPPVYARIIFDWVQAAHRITLRRLTVLTVADRETAKRIREDWRLRPLIGEALSPHHLVVDTDNIETLCKKLGRRGLTVLEPQPPGSGESVSAAEYQYLALSVYRRLSQIITPEIRLPGQVVATVREKIAPDKRTFLDQAAAGYADRAYRVLSGQRGTRGGVAPQQPDEIVKVIQAALPGRLPLRVRYYSPYSGQETVRTIEPVMLYQRAGVHYLDAWCQLDDDSRTFRLDRILEIIDAPPDQSAVLQSPLLLYADSHSA